MNCNISTLAGVFHLARREYEAADKKNARQAGRFLYFTRE
jgi:hypothetical protein